MQNVQTLKNKGQEQLSHLAESVKESPSQAKAWGVTAGAAAAGALGFATVGALLASTPVALTVGAVTGGWLGWKYIHGRPQPEASGDASDNVDPAVQSVAVSATESIPPADPASTFRSASTAHADSSAVNAAEDGAAEDTAHVDPETRGAE